MKETKTVGSSISDHASGYKNDANFVMLAVAVIALGSLLRFVLAAISHPAGDSCYHLSVARFIAESSRLPLFEPFGISDRMVFSAPPLFHIVAAAVYRFFSLFSLPSAEFAVKLISPLFGSLVLLFVFLIGRKLYSGRVAFFATLFVAFLPLHINSGVVSFVDSLATLLASVSIYLILSRKIFLAAVAVGLGVLAKQTLIFMLPVFFFALFKNYGGIMKMPLKKSVIAAAIIAIIGLPWLVRNYLVLGNPFWPFLYAILGGSVVPEGISGSFSFSNLLSLQHPVRFFLELFGAPVGNLGAASFVNLPFSGILVAVWLAASAVFFLPVVLGVFAKGMRHRYLVYAWLAAFLTVTVLYIMSLGIVSARFILPAAPALGILWALGVDGILKKFARLKIAAVVVLILIGCVFIFTAVESAKTAIAARSWSAYSEDFNWVEQNTPVDALIAYRGQCLSYNVHRFSSFDLSKADYVWVNQGFRLEPISIVEPEVLQEIKQGFVPVYSNERTGTVVYKRQG